MKSFTEAFSLKDPDSLKTDNLFTLKFYSDWLAIKT